MKRVSKLSILFRDELQNISKDSTETPDIVEENPSDSLSNNAHDWLTRSSSSWSSSSFQMPLHYPNYTKEDYEVMSEEELDRLFKLYGLPIIVGDDLTCKREFAGGAFLWENGVSSSLAEHDLVNPNSSIADPYENSFMGLMADFVKVMVHFIFRVLQVNEVKP